MKQNIIRDKCNQNKESDENRIDQSYAKAV